MSLISHARFIQNMKITWQFQDSFVWLILFFKKRFEQKAGIWGAQKAWYKKTVILVVCFALGLIGWFVIVLGLGVFFLLPSVCR